MHPDDFLKRRRKQGKPMLSDSEKDEVFASLTNAVVKARKEFVDFRRSSGIEKVWQDCEEAYLGIDDMNRHEWDGAKWAKPMSMEGPLTSSRIVGPQTRSTAFVRITSRYVDHATAKLAEILLPIDDKAFSFEATPVPDLIKQLDNKKQLVHPETGQPMVQPAQEAPAPGGQSQPVAQPTQQAVAEKTIPLTGEDLANAVMGHAQDAAEKAETRIYDWMVDAKYPAETRKVIHDAARTGTGILKGPFPEYHTYRSVSRKGKKVELRIEKRCVPTVRWVDLWNIFPDPACGEDIHAGSGIFERDYLSKKKLAELKDDDTYLADKIDQVIEEGPGKIYLDGGSRGSKEKKKRFEIWHYYGMQKKSDLCATNTPDLDFLPDDAEEVPAIVSVINDTIIRAVINPLDSGSFPYRVMTWSRRPDSWTGVGVSEQISTAQKMVNASTRSMLNNAGLSSGIQIILDQLGILPADGSWTITPNKIWYKTGDSNVADVRAAFTAVVIPSVQKELMNIIEYGMKLAEESSSIPLITQGQTGPSSPETFGQAELQDNNAHTWLRYIGYRYDDMITEPLVRDMYEWLILDPEVPDDEKGDFVINAHGSSAMIERAIQEQTLMGMFGLAANPSFKIDPAKLFSEYLKAKRIDPRTVQMSEEDQEKLDSQPPQPPIQIAVEQLKGQNAMQLQQAKAQSEQQQQPVAQTDNTEQIKADAMVKVQESRAQAEQAKSQTEADIAQQNGQLRIQELQLKKELALLQYAHDKEMKLEDVKVQMAKASMDNQTKTQLAAAEIQLTKSEAENDRVVDLHKHHTSLVRSDIPVAE